MAQDDLLVQSRFKNAILFGLMAGRTAEEVSALTGVTSARFGQLLNLKVSPKNRSGKYRPEAVRIASHFKMLPEDVFPDELYALNLPAVVSRTYTSEEVLPLLAAKTQLSLDGPGEKYEVKEKSAVVGEVLGLLRGQEREVLMRRFGIGGSEPETLHEIASSQGVTPERIRQIEHTALRHLRQAAGGRGRSVMRAAALFCMD